MWLALEFDVVKHAEGKTKVSGLMVFNIKHGEALRNE